MTPILEQCDCRNLPLKDNQVALTVTSPPYWNSIDYAKHIENPNTWYRTRAGNMDEYYEFLHTLTVECFGEVQRVTVPGGFCAVVIGTILVGGMRIPFPQEFLVKMVKEVGWDFHEEIVWHKVTGGVKRAGVFIQKPYPGKYYPNIMTERVQVYRKPGNRVWEMEEELEVDDLFLKEVANDVWHIPPVPPHALPHPCPFPEEIPYRVIQLYSEKGEYVLDPFCGIGTTVKVAEYLGRKGIGYDEQVYYVERAREFVHTPIGMREGQLMANWIKVPFLTQDSLL